MNGQSNQLTGGIAVGHDGRVHTTFGHNPSSGRLCSFDPNMQNIPRGGSGFRRYAKDFFCAPSGSTFWARDFSGIEAVLVGYFAGANRYVRLAKRDVHSFYTAHAICALDPVRFNANDLPSIDWPDDRLFARLAEIKGEFKEDRNNLYKHLVHGANFLQTPDGAAKKIFKDTGIAYPVPTVRRVMGTYFELFPEIRVWHRQLCNQVDGDKKREANDDNPAELGVCYVRNPFGYVHRFYNVLDWEKIDGKWYSTFGEDAKRLVSFLPQSTAAAIIKSAARRIYYDHPCVGETLRLLIHDEIFGECSDGGVEECLRISGEVMESPHLELPLDPAWGMGSHLSIGTEAKVGRVWSEMH